MFAAFIIVLCVCVSLGLYSDTLRSSLLIGPDGGGVTRQNVYTGANGKINASLTVNDGQTNQIQLISFGYATLQLIYITSDQNVKLSINDIYSGSPLFSVDLIAGKPWIWANDGAPYFTNPFGTTNVTSFHWKNASGSTANIVGEVIY